jgi:hypothetical protein
VTDGLSIILIACDLRRRVPRQYWARIGHGFDVINYGRARISCPKVTSDKAIR